MHAKDRRKTTRWAIAPVGAINFGVGVGGFKLLNRDTWREHDYVTFGFGPSFNFAGVVHAGKALSNFVKHGTKIESALKGGDAIAEVASSIIDLGGSNWSYVNVTTRMPVSFYDFHGAGIRYTQANIGFAYGYSISYLTLWTGPAYFARTIAYVGMPGWSAMIMPSGGFVHGIGLVSYGSGSLSANAKSQVERPFKADAPDARSSRLGKISTNGHDDQKLVLPGDALFDLNEYKITLRAEKSMKELAFILNNRLKFPVSIHGHTDSLGADAYNMDLSVKRATAVKNWLVKAGVVGAIHFKVKGYGEGRPVAPNKTASGGDNPQGRAQNRRVEIKFTGRVMR